VSALAIRAAGPGATIQDGGRHGWLRWGVTAAGPMDPLAFATANLAIGNSREAGAIEISFAGLEIEAEEGPLGAALVAPGFDARLGGQSLPPASVFRLEPGEGLSVRPGTGGAWAYLAVAGRLDLPAVLGSLSTHARSAIGGLAGRWLQAGDRIGVVDAGAGVAGIERVVAPWLDASEAPIRVLPGPQDDYFSPEAIAAFLDEPWIVSPRSDRMAYALEGRPLRHLRGHDIVSDGVAHGAIQVPGSGLPFVLMADRQPTGGYPKIATVIGADLGRVAQKRPGEAVRFAAVTREEAVAARRGLSELLARPFERQPVLRGVLTSEFLLSCNLQSRFGV